MLILVDDGDNQIGTAEKLETHRNGLLHRAFSIFITNTNGDFLLQRRNQNKYHSGGLWANTTCGHPFPGESTKDGAERRLFEEMGILCSLTEFLVTRYSVQFDNGLSENEIVHLFWGRYDDDPIPNPDEVDEWAWVAKDQLATKKNAYWFDFYLQEHLKKILSLC